ncbi:MAG: ergothioneine biosynthesis protein EgtB, partial [Pseudomonadota bacterium]|nr:ergothioneine biosynthesis protein EgtB [Pseudomonadota bacterium]
MKNTLANKTPFRQQALHQFETVRQETEKICQPLEIEDYVIQTAVEVSPPKWHLAHVSWFFETFILRVYAPEYRCFNPYFGYIFNSYYQQVGQFHPRRQRGLLSRPTVAEIYRYRTYVDEHMKQLLETADEAIWPELNHRLLIGLNHEQQHQELLLTDILYNFALNPLSPRYRNNLAVSPTTTASELTWLEHPGGLDMLGCGDEGFAYDNERPQHQVYIAPFRLSSRLITNGEYLAFIEAGGYQRPEFWLSDGWQTVCSQQWQAPLYWEKIDTQWWSMTLGGLVTLNLAAPVCHLSYYEADAFATWAGKRLPSEAEWEVAARNVSPLPGNFREQDYLQPIAASTSSGLHQMYGDVWEWTRSPYAPYPGYRALSGALGE